MASPFYGLLMSPSSKTTRTIEQGQESLLISILRIVKNYIISRCWLVSPLRQQRQQHHDQQELLFGRALYILLIGMQHIARECQNDDNFYNFWFWLVKLFFLREGRRLWGLDDLNLTEVNMPAVTLGLMESSSVITIANFTAITIATGCSPSLALPNFNTEKKTYFFCQLALLFHLYLREPYHEHFPPSQNQPFCQGSYKDRGSYGVSPPLVMCNFHCASSVWETSDIWPSSSVLAVTQNEFNQHDFNYFKIN